MAEQVFAPMVGKVFKIECKVGDKVKEDDTLIILEAMKMEIPVVSPVNGTVQKISVAVGDSVEADALLLEIS